MVAHIGDGNFHFTIIIDPVDSHQLKQAKAFHRCVIDEAISQDGTCTGEHGIGKGKKDYLKVERGESLFIMELLKKSLDPKNILNPGNLLDV
jgi:D-lactate dehydrogenase (cytochrome)